MQNQEQEIQPIEAPLYEPVSEGPQTPSEVLPVSTPTQEERIQKTPAQRAKEMSNELSKKDVLGVWTRRRV